MNVHHLVSTYGYGIVALFVGIESLGIPLPGETAIIAAGAYAGTTHKLSPWIIFLCAAGAAIVGDNIGYEIGRIGGYRLLRRYGKYIRINERELKVGRYIFDRQGPKVVFFGRFVSVLRTYAAFLAGTNRMRWSRFMPWNALGGVVWSAIYSFLAYKAGGFLQRSSSTINIALGVVAVVIVVATLLFIRRQTGVIAGKAEAAYPGPLEDHPTA
jgi:membrane protein DedA with SNARE-associated domain